MHRAQRAPGRRLRPAASLPASAGKAQRAASALSGSRATPGKGRRSEEIPERGNHGAAQPGHPVGEGLEEQPFRHREVDEAADTAARVEAEQAAPYPAPAQPLIAVGEDVVEKE